MLSQLALVSLWGFPLLAYMGILTLVLLLITAFFGISFYKKWLKLPFKIHPTFAVLTILSALFHGLLGLSLFFRF